MITGQLTLSISSSANRHIKWHSPWALQNRPASFSLGETPALGRVTESGLRKCQGWQWFAARSASKWSRRGTENSPVNSLIWKSRCCPHHPGFVSQPCKPHVSVANSPRLTSLWDVTQSHWMTPNANLFLLYGKYARPAKSLWLLLPGGYK